MPLESVFAQWGPWASGPWPMAPMAPNRGLGNPEVAGALGQTLTLLFLEIDRLSWPQAPWPPLTLGCLLVSFTGKFADILGLIG